MHQAVLAWATDGFLIATALRPHAGIGQDDAHRGLSTGVVGHTIVFHEPFRADEWLLLAHRSPYAGRRPHVRHRRRLHRGRPLRRVVRADQHGPVLRRSRAGRRHAVPDGDVRLEGRVAIVTGASRGIGEAVARLFAREGAAVAVVARTEQVFDERLPGTIHDTVAAIEADGGRAVAIRADLARRGRRRPRRRRGARRVRPDRPAGEQRRAHRARASAERGPRRPRRHARRGATSGAHHDDAAGFVPRLPAEGLPAALPDRTVRELPPHAAGAPRHDRARARRHREHQLAGRVRARPGSLRAPWRSDRARVRRQQGGDAPPHAGGRVRGRAATTSR